MSALPPEPAFCMRWNNCYKAKEQRINDYILVVVKVVKVVSWTILYVTLFSIILFYVYTHLSQVLGEDVIDTVPYVLIYFFHFPLCQVLLLLLVGSNVCMIHHDIVIHLFMADTDSAMSCLTMTLKILFLLPSASSSLSY